MRTTSIASKLLLPPLLPTPPMPCPFIPYPVFLALKKLELDDDFIDKGTNTWKDIFSSC
jgi:hypothetical protein